MSQNDDKLIILWFVRLIITLPIFIVLTTVTKSRIEETCSLVSILAY